jgi:hypothetical protein
MNKEYTIWLIRLLKYYPLVFSIQVLANVFLNLLGVDISNWIYCATGATRSLRLGGSLVGNVSISGFEDYESVNFSAHAVSVQANANPLFSHCTFGSKLISGASTSTLTVNDCSFDRPTVDDYNIDMSPCGSLPFD